MHGAGVWVFGEELGKKTKLAYRLRFDLLVCTLYKRPTEYDFSTHALNQSINWRRAP